MYRRNCEEGSRVMERAAYEELVNKTIPGALVVLSYEHTKKMLY